jgi:hypothetical protein
MQVVGCPRRIGGCLKDRPRVMLEDGEPAIDIAGMIGFWFEFGRDPEIGAEECTAEFGNEFFPGAFGAIPGVAGEVSIKATLLRGPMRHLVAEDGDIGGFIPEYDRADLRNR